MILTAQQEAAISKISRWYHNSDSQCLRMGGYAGTGKTTLLQQFINGLDKKPLCCAPTGKAASVLQQRLANATVSTIHRALYTPSSASTAELDRLEALVINTPDDVDVRKSYEEEKKRLSEAGVGFSLNEKHGIESGQLVIIDEASMVTPQMAEDLEATGARILYVGDPGQLPPVMSGGFFDDTPPDIMLTEIMRQALDNPIVRLSMTIRDGRDPGYFNHGNCRRIMRNTLPKDEWLTADQVITGKNDTRRKLNRFFRETMGHSPSWWPQAGERVVCLKNTYYGRVLVNGVQGVMLSNARVDEDGELAGDICYEGLNYINLSLYRYPFAAHYSTKAMEEPFASREHLSEFDYAYAVTVHKSQGSEWDKVILADDGIRAGGADFRKRWLYTGITRAKEELIWIS